MMVSIAGGRISRRRRDPRSALVFDYKVTTIGALIIRIGLWGPLYYTYNKEALKK